MDLLERVMARLKPGETAGSSDQALGGPNFFPVIAARVGADVVERQLPFEDAMLGATVQVFLGRRPDERSTSGPTRRSWPCSRTPRSARTAPAPTSST